MTARPKSIYVLRMKYSSEKIIYPAMLHSETLGYFSELKKAEYFIAFPDKDVYWFLQDYPFKIFEIQEYGLNYFYMDDYIRIYDHKGKFYGVHETRNWSEAFYGRDGEDCRFKPGDTVEFIQGSRLNIGMVAGLPPDKKRAREIRKSAKKELEKKTRPLTGFDDDRYSVLTGMGKSGRVQVLVHHAFTPSGKISEELQRNLRGRYKKECANERYIKHD